MPVQFQGVAVYALPGAREGRPDGLHPFLEPAAPALEHCGAVASHASPRSSWYPDTCQFDASLRYFGPLDQIVRSPRCIEPIHVDRMCRFARAQADGASNKSAAEVTGASGSRFLLVRSALPVNASKSGLGSRAVP